MKEAGILPIVTVGTPSLVMVSPEGFASPIRVAGLLMSILETEPSVNSFRVQFTRMAGDMRLIAAKSKV